MGESVGERHDSTERSEGQVFGKGGQHKTYKR